ncbi:MAG: tRNA (adenosine(37)-N6)-dimethylallyltransferase MiaA [Bauldia sp.]|uniref:tRNA (adenosine(37)-N6)-dimethylallyltransferase MiaA n=1 Tax=Bauldia sp. TaxID=2575872 RepID=UPI001D64F41E|nr:tRNA (adenosine(37)-N6)-dimethylallyltransferase MiaA [Bauldia sp.]MCB1495800.1 tRNA (adenosine(37)-N6)-dimethylallyltransferase MiaA [Bauldia sp.]
MTDAILIAGPTASGKSRLAIDIARSEGGTVINADSMQVYRELRILSARPDEVDLSAVPHDLYGHVPATTRYSVGLWLNDAAHALDRARSEGRMPIFVGGTGLYFRALTEGLASIPPVPAEVRERLADETRDVASEVLHARLTACDPHTAGEIPPSDRARICRALEVFEATGRPLAAWREGPGVPPPVSGDVRRMVIAPDRAWLHQRISERADAMLHEGVLQEVRRLLGLGLSPELPAMKAIGVRHFHDHLEGNLSLGEAIAGVKTETRRYAKRQETWFRNQMPDWPRVGPPGP